MNGRANIVFVLSVVLFGVPIAHAEEKYDPFFAPRPDFYDTSSTTPDQADESTPPSPNLVRQIGSDFKNVFARKENLVIAGVGLGAAWATSYFDEEISRSRSNATIYEEAVLHEALEPGRVLGGAAVQIGSAFAAYGFGKLFSKPGVEALGRDLVRAQIVTQTFTQVLKLTVQRERPDGSNNKSFPSGHSSGSFATATVLQRHYGWKVGLPAYAFAGYIACSRLSENKHYLSDVVFGAAIGILVGRTVTVVAAKNRFAVSPILVPTGAVVQFTWLGSSR